MAYLKPRYYNPGGRLLHSASKVPRFSPIAANLMFNMAVGDQSKPIAVYDPFVGNGVIFSIAQINFSDRISSLFGIDTHTNAADAAIANMKMYSSAEILDTRIMEIQREHPDDNKFRNEAIILSRHLSIKEPIPYDIRHGNALTYRFPDASGRKIIVTDPPYGISCLWQGKDGEETRVSQLEDFLQNILGQGFTKVVLSSDNGQNLTHFLEKHFIMKDKRNIKRRILYEGDSKH